MQKIFIFLLCLYVLSTEVYFVDKHKISLIKRVNALPPILDLLEAEGIMQNEDYNNLKAEKTIQEKMRALFRLLDSRGARAKRVFYKGLVENENCIIDDLNEQG